jgi:hypothetical protein
MAKILLNSDSLGFEMFQIIFFLKHEHILYEFEFFQRTFAEQTNTYYHIDLEIQLPIKIEISNNIYKLII